MQTVHLMHCSKLFTLFSVIISYHCYFFKIQSATASAVSIDTPGTATLLDRVETRKSRACDIEVGYRLSAAQTVQAAVGRHAELLERLGCEQIAVVPFAAVGRANDVQSEQRFADAVAVGNEPAAEITSRREDVVVGFECDIAVVGCADGSYTPSFSSYPTAVSPRK